MTKSKGSPSHHGSKHKCVRVIRPAPINTERRDRTAWSPRPRPRTGRRFGARRPSPPATHRSDGSESVHRRPKQPQARLVSSPSAASDLPIRDGVVYAIRARTRAQIAPARWQRMRGRQVGTRAVRRSGRARTSGLARHIQTWNRELELSAQHIGLWWSCPSTRRRGNLAAASPARLRLSSSDASVCLEAEWVGDDSGAAYTQASVRPLSSEAA
jgi:hypothetical protein